MRSQLTLCILLAIVQAAPTPDSFTDFADVASGVLRHAVGAAESFFEDIIHAGQDKAEKWIDVTTSTEFVKQDGIVYELVTHPGFPDYQMRVTSPKLCDPEVKQYSGYIDISKDKHLFFWFFESRQFPEEAPLTLWLNGGPGCSSTTGLLFELGPCTIIDNGEDTMTNPFSWNNLANMIFLDQPADVGYSYSTGGDKVDNTPVAAADVWAFLQLFIGRYRKYAKLPFHIAAESYGGRYAPLIAAEIHKHNQALARYGVPVPGIQHINLHSVLLGNGLTDPYNQYPAVPDYACDGPYPVFKGSECEALRANVPTCQRLIKSCYDYNTRLTCVPAGLYCYYQLFGSFEKLGLNPYDVRRSCYKEGDNDSCYKEMGWIESWLNKEEVKKELGAATQVEFKSCNMDMNQAFALQGDAMRNSAAVIPKLLEEGVRFLVYAGNADFVCNYMGNLAWMLALESPLQEEFVNAPMEDWSTILDGNIVGKVKTTGRGAGNFTYVVVHEAGHMVPFDQPAAARDLFARWITDISLSVKSPDVPLGG